MPTEAELREQFHDARRPAVRPPGHESLDLDAVLRRARARRRPRVVAIAVVSSLAVVGVLVPVSVSLGLQQNGLFSSSSGSAASAPDAGGLKAPQSAPDAASGGAGGGVGIAPAEKVNLCTGTLAELAPASNGLLLTVAPVEAAASDRAIPATVTLTNSGTSTFSGSASPFPALTFSRDGIVLWHSNGAVPSLAQVIDLAPGASLTFSTTFEPVVCGVADDERTSFRADLPAAGVGSYGLSAVLQVSAADGTSLIVSGPVAAVKLH